MSASKCKKISLSLLAISIFIGLFSFLIDEISYEFSGYLFYASLFLLVMFGATIIIYWKCKKCGKSLPFQGIIFIEYCPICGQPVE
jgi:rubrerythrin